MNSYEKDLKLDELENEVFEILFEARKLAMLVHIERCESCRREYELAQSPPQGTLTEDRLRAHRPTEVSNFAQTQLDRRA